uniref:Coenzyme Q-binding protein COQ10 START domain-containing protein n=1 Tax=Calcidiscus leptoporus TaxID=127549 RepID=A0A7S0NQI3_9EUKA|mmetsp:Transcript_13522/g.31076  ORF Transcript_13522/g.31076 Transcript_13522/m.31076 type:complete len:128 (+) Transcript_13522:1-384(+)
MVWRCIRNFDSYDTLIGTVKRVSRYDPEVNVPGTMCYNFLVSRIRLQLNVRWRLDDSQRYASWTLERPSWVLADSSGFWHVQELPEQGTVRVWFFAAVALKARVPGFVVGLVSRLGLRKACSWWDDV